MDGHKWTTVSWGLGCAAFVLTVAMGAGWGLIGRVQWGFFGAAAVAATAMAALLGHAHRHHHGFAHPGELIGEPAS
jgi:hypothetical protein